MLFGGVKLAKNADPDKYVYTGYGIGFYSRSEFLFTDGIMRQNDTKLKAEAQNSINFSRSNRTFCSS